jgi:hypothetical protein
MYLCSQSSSREPRSDNEGIILRPKLPDAAIYRSKCGRQLLVGIEIEIPSEAERQARWAMTRNRIRESVALRGKHAFRHLSGA